MSHHMTRFARRFKKWLGTTPELVLLAITVMVSISIEMIAWGGIFIQNHATFAIGPWTVQMAYLEGFLSLGLGLAALFVSKAASVCKADARREIASKAFGYRFVAFALLVAPIYYGGNAVAFNRQHADWQAYNGSEQHRADAAMAADAGLDSMARRDAAYELRRAIEPTRAEFDVWSTAWIAFLYIANMLAAGVRFPKPETEAQAKRRLAQERAAKGAETRKRKAREAVKVDRKVIPFNLASRVS